MRLYKNNAACSEQPEAVVSEQQAARALNAATHA
jgi:hypothetical protein